MSSDGTERSIISGKMSESALKRLLSGYGISTPKGIVARSLESGPGLKYPVVLKVSDPDILHKSDVGGVSVGIENFSRLKDEFGAMKKKFPGREFLIEEMAEPGVEAIIGVVRDVNFGHAIMLGMGGIYTEIYHDVSFRLVPTDSTDAEEMIEGIQLNRFIEGFRNVKISKEKLVSLLVRVSKIVSESGGNVQQLDLNPVILNENSAVVVDAKVMTGGE